MTLGEAISLLSTHGLLNRVIAIECQDVSVQLHAERPVIPAAEADKLSPEQEQENLERDMYASSEAS
jgi:hypothetical protein